jgi:hypothetical protein
MATPLVRIPQPQGGTMYAFASAARDITRAFNNPDLKFEFSRYALLDLPDFTSSVNGSNTIDYSLLKDTSGANYSPSTNGPGVDFANTFQNYALNAEELLLQDDDFDPVLYKSDAEKLFFKWLSATGSIRFRGADSTESNVGNYTEDPNSEQTGQVYDRIVKYLGTIDAENDIAYKGNAYHEVYINVPSSAGTTPTVLFEPSDFNTTATKLYADPQWIEGRNNQSHPDPNLDLDPVVDEYDSGTGPYYDINTNGTNSVGIDWNEQSYYGITNDSDVKNFNDFSKRGQDFRFNAVLVYYDLYSASTPGRRSTNLYGILILDDIQSLGGIGSRIHEQIKYKPNEVTGLNGNAYSLKLNIKFNTSLDNVGVETNVNDFTTFSMDLFMDTTTLLENAAELLIKANDRYGSISQRLDEMEKLVLASESAEDLEERIKELENDFQNTSTQLQDSDALLKLITKAHDKLNSLIDGTIPVELQYNTDVLFDGIGTEIDKSVPEKIKVNSTVKSYENLNLFLWDLAAKSTAGSITKTSQFDINDSSAGLSLYGVWARLKPFTNRISFIDKLSTSIANDDFNIYIDDSINSWKEGQVVRITFETIDMNGNDIKIFTRTSGGFDIQIADIIPAELITNKPYIEVICTNPITYEFEVDIIR